MGSLYQTRLDTKVDAGNAKLFKEIAVLRKGGTKMYTGEKVRLREYRKEDIPLALQYINDSEVKRFLAPGIPYPFTLENESSGLKGYRQTMIPGYLLFFQIS